MKTLHSEDKQRTVMPILQIYVSRCKYAELRSGSIASLLGDAARIVDRVSSIASPHCYDLNFSFIQQG
jgi:hypothetical protein